MISVGWPILIVASVFIIIKSWIFYREVEKSPFGKLVAGANAGWLATMYSLGIVATFYLFRDVTSVRIVFPVFAVWVVSLILILYTTVHWSSQASTLHAFYTNLAAEVERRSRELDTTCKNQLENEKKIQQLKDEILFVAAHELRSPVSAIKWGLSTLLEEKDFAAHLSTHQKDLLLKVYVHNERLENLVSRLLNTARIEQGVLSIKKERVYLSSIASEVMDEVKHATIENNIRIFNTIGNPPPVLADSTLVKEILTNLITNAIRYNVPDGTVTITARHTDAMVTVHVSDTGQGIPRDQLTDIFQKFHKVPQKRTLGKDRSIGLGLYITKELVTRMGGTIRAISELGEGSTFIFTLPRDRA